MDSLGTPADHIDETYRNSRGHQDSTSPLVKIDGDNGANYLLDRLVDQDGTGYTFTCYNLTSTTYTRYSNETLAGKYPDAIGWDKGRELTCIVETRPPQRKVDTPGLTYHSKTEMTFLALGIVFLILMAATVCWLFCYAVVKTVKKWRRNKRGGRESAGFGTELQSVEVHVNGGKNNEHGIDPSDDLARAGDPSAIDVETKAQSPRQFV